jgi:hypothetical protein
VLPENENADNTEFEQMLARYEKFVPVKSLNRQQWDDLQTIALSKQLNLKLRKRLIAYLGQRPGFDDGQ